MLILKIIKNIYILKNNHEHILHKLLLTASSFLSSIFPSFLKQNLVLCIFFILIQFKNIYCETNTKSQFTKIQILKNSICSFKFRV